MSMLFRWKGNYPPVGTINASVLRPDQLASLKVAELKQQRITIGRHDYAWSDVFEIEGDPSSTWTLPGAANYLYLAMGMGSGLIRVQGDAGDFAGQQMLGGRLEIHGSAGHSLGAGMQGGLITVAGDTGTQVGGPCHDAHVGMTDGEIIIQGTAGPRAGFRKRRGLIAAHRCDEQAGNHMQAGTIVVYEGPLRQPGLSMKRGTILCLDPKTEVTWLPYFQPDCIYRPVFVQIMLGRLLALGCKLPEGARHGKYQLYSGDRLSNGKAEILQWLSN